MFCFLPSHAHAVLPLLLKFPNATQTETNAGWADRALSALGYFKNPSRVQSILRSAFTMFTSELSSADIGCPIIPLPLYKVLDCMDENDYVMKVEPSAVGGAKMAAAFLDALTPAPPPTESVVGADILAELNCQR